LFKKALNYAESGDTQSTADCYHQILTLDPNYFPALVNLGNIVKDQGQYQEALDLYERALIAVENSTDNNSNPAPIHNNLANIYKDRGQTPKAIEHFRLAVKFDPSLAMGYSNLIFCLNYSSEYQPEQIYQEHLNWNQDLALPLSQEIKPHLNDLNPHRRLKIGYVSKDFGCHPVSYFFGSILANHNRNDFEMICYSNNPNIDDLTRLLQRLADDWRQIDPLSDEEVTDLIRQDQIDILVDLSGHTAGNRMLVFARKPAPIQVSYLAYPNTTALSTMDYRLTDAWADPPRTTEHLHTEQLIRLPHGFLCYQPPSNTPPVNDLPVLQKGYVTFGCFNNLAKVNPELVDYWCQILNTLPTAKMIIKSKPLADPPTRDYLTGLFEQHGINPSRLEIYGNINPYNEHLALYHHIDIALDTFPYHGTTTTCEALWMGIPVITLAGKSHVSRVGVSLLSSVGLQSLIADSPPDYIQKAIVLGQNPPQLQQLRSNLRAMMQSSPLTNGPLFTQSFESALRTMWQNYCSH
jgi:predicted O-linked N-acetylglucosamine transferase (SPINDLY family)